MKTHLCRVSTILALILFAAVSSLGQTKTSIKDQYEIHLKKLISDLSKTDATEANKREAFDPNTNPQIFLITLAKRKAPEVFAEKAEEARLDKQVGGGDENSGSTSLTSKGSIPSILGFAVENGALSRDISGTTITFRGNPVGIIKALGKAGFTESYREDDDDPATRFLRRFSFAISFDTSRGAQMGSDMNVFTGDRQQLSSYSFRLDIVNRRDPRDKSYDDEWGRLIGDGAVKIAASLNRASKLLDTESVFTMWLEKAQEEIVAAKGEAEIEQTVKDKLLELEKLELSPALESELELYLKTYSSFLSGRDGILAAVAKGGIITFEYTNRREVDMPDLSNFKLIAETGLFKGKADLTANASLTIFNRKMAGQDRVRDFQLSGQLDVPLGDTLKVGNFVLSLSGKYERMMENTMMDNGMMMDTKGNIGIGQIKLTIPVKGSGFKIPISITFANRTELIKEKEVRGNIGFTFDLDSLFAKFKP